VTVPTRFYLSSTTAAAVAPANDAWNATAGAAAARQMARARTASAMATITANGTGTVGQTSLLRQYVSESMPYAQTITGKAYGIIRCIESSSAGNNTLAFSLRVCSSDGATIRTPALLAISASDSTADPYEMGRTTATASAFYDSSENCYHTLGTVSASAGDRIVLEIGFRAGSTTTTRTGGVVCGDDSATDLPFTSINTNTDNPWIEFSADLFVQPGAGYFS